ncbi:hypothetical protein WJX84_007292 [Apatococcus fuscideae]|uniref:15-cis-phytoene synthase n=1 Tax=Apatococcus fuscideae TaxID=2026836 RepID=A0AAW1T542_9CHLO
MARFGRGLPSIWRYPVLAEQAARGFASRAAGDNLRVAFAYCSDQVRKYDHDNFICSLQLKPDLRAAVLALRAFNVETGLVGENVREQTLAQIRMQWWREAVNGMYRQTPHEHPIVQALTEVIAAKELTRYRLQQIVTAREDDLLRLAPPASVADMEQYGRNTAAQLLLLQLESADLRGQPEIEHAALHLGQAQGITALLRGTHYHAARRRSYLPTDLCKREDLSHEQLFRGESSDALCNVMFEVASVAKGHLEEARRLRPSLPPLARLLMLPAVSVGLYLDALETCNFDAFAQRMLKQAYSPLWHQTSVKLCSFRGTY